MKTKRSYAAVDVESFDAKTVLPLLTTGCIVAIDVAKTKFVAAIATASGDTVKLVKFEHPRQTEFFLEQLSILTEGGHKPSVVMEATGTYGDAVRYQCHQRGLTVHMMAPKHTHDFAEVFDGVPSMHDAKAAMVLAKLQAIKPARAWAPDSDERRDLRAWVDQRRLLGRTIAIYYGHLEAMMARHWPEAEAHFDVHRQRSWMALMKTLPGPKAIAAEPDGAKELLRKASRGHFDKDRLEALIASAEKTTGLPMTGGEQEKLRAIVEQLETQLQRLAVVDSKLREFAENDDVLRQMTTVVGPTCSAAIGALVGSPTEFGNARAFAKAMGLNLKEKSSGNVNGRLSITKRGPGVVRHLLYLAALRMLKDASTIPRAWYRARESHKAKQSSKAVVALMRKLARALWHVGRGATFDPRRLFDTRRLGLSADAMTLAKEINASPLTMAATPAATCEGGAALL
jgi:transposase